MDFCHLHVHSHYSLYRSTVRNRLLVERAASLGMTSLALTDHGNLFGAIKFMWACRNFRIKPIFGAEVLVENEDEKGRDSHLVLLCRTSEGFANLRNIITRSYLDGCAGVHPTTTRDILAGNSGGLTALSGCLEGAVPQAVLKGDIAGATSAAREWDEVFGRGNFFLELEGNDQEEQATVNEALAGISADTGIPLVATNNVHYLNPEDAALYAVLDAMPRYRRLSSEQLKNLPRRRFHFATQNEMAVRFANHPEALLNTMRIAESVSPDVLEPSRTLHFPVFDVPEGKPPSEVLTEMAGEGLARRIETARERGEDVDEKTYRTRLDRELEQIIRLGFDSYFLVVADYVEWARGRGIPVGPGRGTGAGCLVAWAMGITEVDPIRFGLLFERFINTEYVRPPDFDIDFPKEGCQEVMDYVAGKYGADCTMRIVTIPHFYARPALMKVARVMGFTYSQMEEMASLIPVHHTMTLKRAMEEVPQFADLVDGPQADPKMKEILDIASGLERISAHFCPSTSSIVTADVPISECVPLCKTDEGVVVTQYEWKDVEDVGLTRLDFFDLEVLAVIDDAVKAIRSQEDTDFNIEDIPLDDRKTFEMLSSGSTRNVFQLESPGITELVRRVKPDCFEDIAAILALYRPGPLVDGMVDDFIRSKHIGRPGKHLVPEIEPILKETYGVFVYQEQLMRIAEDVAGFSPGRADRLRWVLGTKKVGREAAALRDDFIEGAAGGGMKRSRAQELFQQLETFAEHGFNKSHCVSYALLTYRTAFLKANHPTEFKEALRAVKKKGRRRSSKKGGTRRRLSDTKPDATRRSHDPETRTRSNIRPIKES